MSAIDSSVVGQRRNYMAQTGQQLLPRAPLKIGAPHAHAKQRVAREQHFLGFAIEGNATWGVSRCVEHTQLMTAERDAVAIGKETPDGRCGTVVGHAEHVGCLLGQIGCKKLVFGMQLGLETESIIDRIIAEAVVQMAVSAEQTYWLQVLIVQISHDGLAFAIEKGTTVNNNALPGLIADYISILLKQIELKSLDVQHNSYVKKRKN